MDTAPLSSVFSAKGPFATVLIDVSHDSENAEQEHDLRVRAACEALTEQGADASLVESIRDRLGEKVTRPAPVARLVVASADGILLDEIAGFRTDQQVATYGTLPDLSDWIAHKDGTRSFVLAVVDHVGGDVAVYDSDVPEPEEETDVAGQTLHAHKVPVGGWSALRYQHVTENVWAQNAAKVAEEIEKHVRSGQDLVLLAGDPQSRPLVLERLQNLPATVRELESGTRAEDGGDEAMQQAIREALLEDVVQRRLSVSHELKDRLGRENAATTGVRDVADAFVRGQVETLVLDPNAARELTLDTSQHPGLAVGVEGELRADQALVAAAVLTGAAVVVSPSAALGGAPVAALLRWHQDAVGDDTVDA
jgi:hypothetical protein